MDFKHKAFQLLPLCAALVCALPTAAAQHMNVPDEVRSEGLRELLEEVRGADNEVEYSDKLRLEQLLRPETSQKFKLIGSSYTGELEEMGRQLVTVTVPEDTTGPILLASCGEDCNDIDLFVYDKQGHFIGSDEYEDALPAIALHGYKAGDTLTAEVVMFECYAENDACTYSLNFFSRE